MGSIETIRTDFLVALPESISGIRILLPISLRPYARSPQSDIQPSFGTRETFVSVEIFFKDCHVTPELTRGRWHVGYKVRDDLFIPATTCRLQSELFVGIFAGTHISPTRLIKRILIV
ncbi:hypothetical protein [Rhizobium leguminosarum]|uniref:hypothetical protein n=1 Tax=Rhizobium leguminosarum TaxID=384 RepID=UPI003F999395